MTMRRAAIFLLLAAMLLAPPGRADAADGMVGALETGCLSDWGAAGEIVRREKLTTVEEVAQALAADGVGKVLKTTLCLEKGAYVYRMVVQNRHGQLKTTTISAAPRH